MRRTLSVGVMRGTQRDLAYVEDVSPGGVRLRGIVDAAVGDVLRLHAKGCVFSVQVRWVRGVICGVRFQTDNDPGEIRRFLALSLCARQARHGVVPIRELTPITGQLRPQDSL